MSRTSAKKVHETVRSLSAPARAFVLDLAKGGLTVYRKTAYTLCYGHGANGQPLLDSYMDENVWREVAYLTKRSRVERRSVVVLNALGRAVGTALAIERELGEGK